MPHLLPKKQNKIQPANKKNKREFFRRENTRCTFLFGASRPKFPVYIHQPQRPDRQSPNAFFCSFEFQDAKTRGAHFFSIQNHHFRLGRPISPTVNPLSRPAIQPPTRQLISFRRHPAAVLPSYFPTLPDRLHIPSRRQPANISRRPSFHTGPTILNKPTPFLPAWPADALHPFLPLF